MNEQTKAQLTTVINQIVHIEMGKVVKHQLLRGENRRLYTAVKKEVRETVEAAFKSAALELL